MSFARITKYTKQDPESPGWIAALEFEKVEAGVRVIPSKFFNHTVLNQYLSLFSIIKSRIESNTALVPTLFVLEDSTTHYTVLACPTSDDLAKLMEELEGNDSVFTEFEAARNELAASLSVTVSVYPSVQVELTDDTMSIEAVSKALDGLTPA